MKPSQRLNQTTLRTKKTQCKYMDYLDNEHDGTCIYCRALDRGTLVREYKHWILVKNQFPYDNVFTNHNMLATRRHVTEKINMVERKELEFILEIEDYNMCILNNKADRSVPMHFHYHLVSYKK